MTIALTINGVSFAYPESDNVDWGGAATAWASAVTSGMLQKAGGNFTLLADVNFGPNFGLLSSYFTSRTASPATAGTVRLAAANTIAFRNLANSANLLLGVAADKLQFGGVDVILSGLISNADIAANAAIAFSKLAALPSAQILIGNASNVATAIAITGDVLISNAGVSSIASAVIVNADIAANAAIDATKLANGTVSNSEYQFLDGVTSAIQTQITANTTLANTKADTSALNAHTGATSGVHGVAGSVVGTTDTQSFTNKTFSDAVLLTEIATPATPAASRVRLYSKSDGNIYKMAAAGGEQAVGSVAGVLPGLATGGAIGAGFVGQVLTGTFLTPTLVNNTSANMMSLVLTAGVWVIYGKCQTGTAGTTYTRFETSIGTTSATLNAKSQVQDNYASNDKDRNLAPNPIYISTSSATAYLVVRVLFTGAAPVPSTGFNELYAVRVA